MINLVEDIDISFEGFERLHRDLWDQIGKDAEWCVLPRKLKEKLVRETYEEYDPNLYEALASNSDCFACVYANQKREVIGSLDHFCPLCPITKWRGGFNVFGKFPCRHMEYGDFLASKDLDERNEAAEKIKNLEWSRP